MPRAKAPPRVIRPYYHPGRDKWRIRIFDGVRQQDVWCTTEKDAELAAAAARKNLVAPSRRLSLALDEYFDEKQRHGIARPQTCIEQRACLRRFFVAELDEDLSKLTPRRAEAIYTAAVTRPTLN